MNFNQSYKKQHSAHPPQQPNPVVRTARGGLGRVRPNEIRSVLFDRLLSRWQSLRKDKRKPQISPLRYAPVEMTIMLEHSICVSKRGPRTADPSASLGMTKERATIP
jgi:hypothetical protein